MKYLYLIALVLLAACTQPTQPEETAFTDPSSSSVAAVTPGLSSTTIYVPSSAVVYMPSSAYYIAPSSVAQVVTPEVLYIAEIGYVCNGFNTAAVSNNKATEGFIAMYNICGDRATMTSGTQPRTVAVINNWMTNDLALNPSFVNLIESDVIYYGSSLRFYNAVDGYLRYLYIEPVGDGIGLMKQRL